MKTEALDIDATKEVALEFIAVVIRFVCRKCGFVASDIFRIRDNGRMLKDDEQTARN